MNVANGEINKLIQNLLALESKVQGLRSSCPWGREQVEDVEFFRKYITQGNTAFLSQYNGYKKLKPFVYTLYQNPKSPSLLDSNCLKSFSFSSLRIAWSEYLSKGEKSNKRFSEGVGGPYDFRRFYENLDKSVESFAKQLIEKPLRDPNLKNLGQIVESFSIAILFREVFDRYISKVILSKEQSKISDKIVKVLEKKSDEIKAALFAELEKNKESFSLEDVDLEEIKKSKDFDRVLAREYFLKNRGVVNRNKVESLVSEIRRSLSPKDREAAEEILTSSKQFFTSPGQIKLGDVPKILGGAEAISLARKIYSYLKLLEDIAKDLEEQNRKLQKLVSRESEEDVKKNGNGRESNGRNEKQNHPPISTPNKKRLEEFFRGVLEEISILYELLDFLTKRYRGFEKLKRDLRKTFKRITDAIKSIAEKLGLRNLLTPQGIVSLLSELALQLT